jgi:deoxycytidine triphosphate deaminase
MAWIVPTLFCINIHRLTGATSIEHEEECLATPFDLEAQVEGRSSWARVGLQIATATSVEPGFKGVLTLELSNLGTIPIELYPGVRIAQLFLHDATPELQRPYGTERKYKCPVGPQFSHIHADKDGRIFTKPID